MQKISRSGTEDRKALDAPTFLEKGFFDRYSFLHFSKVGTASPDI
jgi:hypothetical protein